jgi:hypothetical protein
MEGMSLRAAPLPRLRIPSEVFCFSVSVSECTRPDLGEDACQRPIGVESVLHEAMGYIERNIGKRTSLTSRVAPVILSRLARGGKTTALCLLFDELKRDGRFSPIMITFNGSSYFQLYEGESHKAAILRLIATQLLGSASARLPHTAIECDEGMLDAHLGEIPTVLLIDELNALGVPLDVEAGLLLRKMFLDKANRYLVFTTHVPMNVDMPASSAMGPSLTLPASDRGCHVVSLPTCMNETELQSMGYNCSGLTHAEVAYYGGIPSLVYAVKTLFEQPRDRFRRQCIYVPDAENDICFHQFLDEMFSGIRKHASVRRFDMFSTLVAEAQEPKVRWPPCYIACILQQVNLPTSNMAAEMLNSFPVHATTSQSGLDWEVSVQVAIFLRCVLHMHTGSGIPFFRSANAVRPTVEHTRVPENIRSLDALLDFIQQEGLRQGVDNIVVLYTFAFAKFPLIDGLLVLTTGNSRTCAGVQMKEGNDYPSKAPPEWIENCYLIRGRAPSSSNMKRGWHYMSADEVTGLLGYSLHSLYPNLSCDHK